SAVPLLSSIARECSVSDVANYANRLSHKMCRMTLAFDALDSPDSPFAALDARWKLAALVFAGALASALRTPELIYIATVGGVALLITARLPRRFLLPRLAGFGLFLLPFMLMLALLNGRE